MTNNTTGSKIKGLRTKLNLTQQELADKIGVSNKAVSKWESGEGLPDIENLKRLSSIFNVSIDELVSNQAKEKPKSSLGIALLIIALASILLYFLPFIKMSPFGEFDPWDAPDLIFITLSGLQLLKESFINFQIGNILIGLSLILILANAFLHIYSFYKKETISKQRLFSLLSALSSLVILIIMFFIVQDNTLTSEITFVPILLFILQTTQFIVSEMLLKPKSKKNNLSSFK